MTPPTLDRRALNRALLARQLLLQPSTMSCAHALEHLGGLQSQAPQAGYVALWTRLAGFDPLELSGMLESRAAVRIALMRSTVHLMTADDCRWLRPLLATVVARGMTPGSARGKQLASVDRDLLVRTACAAYANGPLTNGELLDALAGLFPGVPADTLAIAVRGLLPLVQVPPRGLWRTPGVTRCVPVQQWIGELDPDPDPHELVRRYLTAFGPASVRDMQAWSGLTRLAAAFTDLGGELLEFRDEYGRTLYDLPDAPRPDGDTPAPVRLLAEWDQILLAHLDRSRILSEQAQAAVFTENGIIHGGILIDGFVSGMWSRSGRVLTVQALSDWTAGQRRQATALAEELSAFLDPTRPPALVMA